MLQQVFLLDSRLPSLVLLVNDDQFQGSYVGSQQQDKPCRKQPDPDESLAQSCMMNSYPEAAGGHRWLLPLGTVRSTDDLTSYVICGTFQSSSVTWPPHGSHPVGVIQVVRRKPPRAVSI